MNFKIWVLQHVTFFDSVNYNIVKGPKDPKKFLKYTFSETIQALVCCTGLLSRLVRI